MLSLKVNKEYAAIARDELITRGWVDGNYKIEREGDYVFIPLSCSDYDAIEQALSSITEDFEIVEREHEAHPSKGCNMIDVPLDIIGDIAIIDGRNFSKEELKKAAENLLNCHKHLKTVRLKETAVSGTYRVRKTTYLTGEDKTETLHKENGIILKLNVDKVYFSPRLSTERQRIASLVKEGEHVAVLFAGVGPYSILIGKRCPTCKVVSVEINPVASKYAEENAKLNKVDNVEVINADVRALLKEERFKGWADRIVMPLPKDVLSFFDVAEYIAKPSAIVHAYIFAEDKEASEREIKKATRRPINILLTKEVGSYSPTLSRWVVDFQYV